MKRSELKTKTVAELKAEARSLGLVGYSALRRDGLVDLLVRSTAPPRKRKPARGGKAPDRTRAAAGKSRKAATKPTKKRAPKVESRAKVASKRAKPKARTKPKAQTKSKARAKRAAPRGKRFKWTSVAPARAILPLDSKDLKEYRRWQDAQRKTRRGLDP